MPPLHLKLGLTKDFFKAVVTCNSHGFTNLCSNFSSLSQGKLKERIFAGPQIWKVSKYRTLKMHSFEITHLESIQVVVL